MSGSFAEARRQAEQQGLLGKGDIYKLKEGSNQIRLCSMCLPHSSVFNGTRSFKWLCHVIDRRDGKVKPFFMPHTIYKQIEALQDSEDYGFTDVPMPYDVRINAKGAGTKDVEYSLIPAKKETLLTEAEREDLAQQKPLAELQEKLKEKAAEREAALAGTTAAPPPPAPLSPPVPRGRPLAASQVPTEPHDVYDDDSIPF
jgi:hypothetical protein